MEETKETVIVNDTPVAKKSNRWIIIVSLIVISTIMVPKFLGSNRNVNSTTPATQIQQVPVNVQADVVDGQIIVEAGSFYFKPNIIKAKKGEKVKLILNSVSMMHDFNIDELNIKVPITKSGNSATVEFSVDKVGEFEFYCSVGQHRQNGQVGKLIVVE